MPQSLPPIAAVPDQASMQTEREAALELLQELQSLYMEDAPLHDQEGATSTVEMLGALKSVLQGNQDMRPRILQVQVNDRTIGWLLDINDIWMFHYSVEWSGNSAFSLSPALARTSHAILDGSSNRPVQWYFDNLLPEEELLKVLAKQAALPFQDAFGMLRHYGAESAGSLVLTPLAAPRAQTGLRPLDASDLNRRVQALETVPLTAESPKRMSLAGAQHKMVVVWAGKDLFEPLPGTPSTHILKPNSKWRAYPHSVINEYFVMLLAKEVGLTVPVVARLYLPEPVYLIERFDRKVHSLDPAQVPVSIDRLHIVDTCQLLNASRVLKYDQATVQTLLRVVKASRSPLNTRQRLFQWLVFNVLVGNSDNHLKNLSFMVSPGGIELAPHYDMLSTAAWDTKGYADGQARWPATPLALPLAEAQSFNQVTYTALLQTGATLGLNTKVASRLLDSLLDRVEKMAPLLLQQLCDNNSANSRKADLFVTAPPTIRGGETQLLRTIYHVIIKEMLQQIRNSKP